MVRLTTYTTSTMSDKVKKTRTKSRANVAKKKKPSNTSDATENSDTSFVAGDDDVLADITSPITENGVSTPSSVNSLQTNVLSVLEGAANKMTNGATPVAGGISKSTILSVQKTGKNSPVALNSPKPADGAKDSTTEPLVIKKETSKLDDLKKLVKASTPKSARKTSVASNSSSTSKSSDRPRSRKASTIETPMKFSSGTKDKRPGTAGNKAVTSAAGATALTQDPAAAVAELSVFTMADTIAEEDSGSAPAQAAAGPAGIDERALPVLRGSLDQLPALPSRIVRIFTSSTFTGAFMYSYARD